MICLNDVLHLQVTLFDNRTSLKVNIFLRQFRLSHTEIIQMLKDGKSKEFGAEKLRGLLKILPTTEEVRKDNSKYLFLIFKCLIETLHFLIVLHVD